MTNAAPKSTPATTPAAAAAAESQDALLMRASWEQLKKVRRNTVRSVPITLRGDLMDEVSQLEEQMRREAEADEWENRTPLAPATARRIRALEEEARESEVLFKFEGLGAGELARLQAAHPATAEVKKRLGLEPDAELEYNPETFPAALMAASCIEPAELKDNVDEWQEIHEGWSNGQVTRLWATCMAANAMVAETPKSERASEILRRLDSANSSTTAPR